MFAVTPCFIFSKLTFLTNLSINDLQLEYTPVPTTFFSDKTDNSKTPTTQEEIIDLGYAVVVDDEGNEIRNY